MNGYLWWVPPTLNAIGAVGTTVYLLKDHWASVFSEPIQQVIANPLTTTHVLVVNAALFAAAFAIVIIRKLAKEKANGSEETKS